MSFSFSAKNGRIYYGNERIRIKGINMFGFETETFSLHGLWSTNLDAALDFVAANKFNMVRLPFSIQMALGLDSLIATGIDTNLNPSLAGATAGKVLDAVVHGCLKRNLLVMPDFHRLEGTGGIPELWYDDEKNYPESKVIQAWLNIVRRYKTTKNLFAVDLKNEPHGRAVWGGSDPKFDWASAAERIGNAILSENPDLLVVVEGVEKFNGEGGWWGGNLMGVASRPLKLQVPDRLVYSPHVYGPDVFDMEYFKVPEFPKNLEPIWHRHFGYLCKSNATPVLIGEWGGKYMANTRDRTWQDAFGEWLRKNDADWMYWCWNPNSGDTKGLVMDDWKTPDVDKLMLLTRTCPNPTKLTLQPMAPPPYPTTNPTTPTTPTTTKKFKSNGYEVTLVLADTWKENNGTLVLSKYEVECVSITSGKKLKFPKFKVMSTNGTAFDIKQFWNAKPNSVGSKTSFVFSYITSVLPASDISFKQKLQPTFGFVTVSSAAPTDLSVAVV